MTPIKMKLLFEIGKTLDPLGMLVSSQLILGMEVPKDHQHTHNEMEDILDIYELSDITPSPMLSDYNALGIESIYNYLLVVDYRNLRSSLPLGDKFFGMPTENFILKYCQVCEMLDIKSIDDIHDDDKINEFCNLLKLV